MANERKIIQIPQFTPRAYQLDFIRAMDRGIRRAVLVWHRRAGKEIACFNCMIKDAWYHRVGTYVYFFPTTTLGRRILWDGVDKNGKKFLDYIPKEIIEGNINNVEMKVKLRNGSIIQVIGSDQVINVGINPVGCVFSEYSLQDPKCWNFIRPILRENGGWAVFNFTPRGKNHAYDLYLMAQHNPEWFCQKLTIADTGVLNQEDMEQERREGMSEHLIQQEYYCSFDQGAEGAYYAKYLHEADLQGRITNVPHDPHAAVHTYWDIGVSDYTVILLAQNIGKEIHIIDMYTNQGEGLAHYVGWLRKQETIKGYNYGEHFAPHDIQVRELGSGAQSRIQIAKELGISFKITPNISVNEGIELVRGTFPRLWIDSNNCKFLLKSIENYHKSFNERLNVYSDKPTHDWSSHCFVGETNILTRHGMYRIMDLPQEGEILTLYGWKKYICPRITRYNAQIVEVTFQDGLKVKCTPDHLFLTELGWKSAKELEKGFKIQSSLMQQHNILMENYIDCGQMKNIFQQEVKKCIEWFGKMHLVKYLKDVTFIIKIEILKIIKLKIWNVCLQPNIYHLQINKVELKEHFPQEHEKKQKNGINLKQEDFGIKEMQKEQKGGQNGKEKKENVFVVIKNLIVSFVKMVINTNFATQIVKHPIIEKIEINNEYSDVWCLTVPDVNHFSLSNGAIVHNCADALRYLAVNQNKNKGSKMTEEEALMMEKMYARKI